MNFVLIGMGLISFAVAYAWWRVVRVYALRQDIFDLRDELFDFAAKNRFLDDPAYRGLRVHLNRFADTASMLSIPFLAFVFTHPEEWGRYEIPQSDLPEMDKKVKETMQRSSRLLCRYLFRCTAVGWLIYCFSLVKEFRNVAGFFIEKLATRWINSDIEHFHRQDGAFQYHA